MARNIRLLLDTQTTDADLVDSNTGQKLFFYRAESLEFDVGLLQGGAVFNPTGYTYSLEVKERNNPSYVAYFSKTGSITGSLGTVGDFDAGSEHFSASISAANNQTSRVGNGWLVIKIMDSGGSVITAYAGEVVVKESGSSSLATGSDYTADTYLKTSDKGATDGVAELDSTGKVPAAQLPVSTSQTFKGTWDADTDSPDLSAIGSPVAGDFYVVAVAGTDTVTGSSVSFELKDEVHYNGTSWEHVPYPDSQNMVAVADSAARVALPPEFKGQILVQQDTIDTDPMASFYVAGSTTTGDWDRASSSVATEAEAKSGSSTSLHLTPRTGRVQRDTVSLSAANGLVQLGRDDKILPYPLSTQLVRFGQFLNGCEFHMRGDRSAGTGALSQDTTQLDTTTVERVIDLSGKGRHLEIVGPPTTKPYYEATGSGIQFKPGGVTSTGAYRPEGAERIFPADMTHNDFGLTVVGVCWVDTLPSGNLAERVFELGTNSSALLTIGGHTDTADTLAVSVTTRKRASETIKSTLTVATGEANKFVFAVRIRDREMEFWMDGESQGVKGPATSTSVSLEQTYLANCVMSLGAGKTGSGTPTNVWEGGICELALFSRGLSTPELDWVQSSMATGHGVTMRGSFHNNVVVKETGLAVAERTEPAAFRPAGRYALSVYGDDQYANTGASPKRILSEIGTNDPVSSNAYPAGSLDPVGSTLYTFFNLSSKYNSNFECGGVIEVGTGASLDIYSGLYVSGDTPVRLGGGDAASGVFGGFIARYQDPLSGTVEDQGTGMWCNNTALYHSNGSIYRMHAEMFSMSVRISREEPDGTVTNVELAQNLSSATPNTLLYNDRYHLGVCLVELDDGKIAAFWTGHFHPYLYVVPCSEDLGTIPTPQNLVGGSAKTTYLHPIKTADGAVHLFTRGSNDGVRDKGTLHLKITGIEDIGTTPATVSYDQVICGDAGAYYLNNYIASVRLHTDPDSGDELIVIIWNPVRNDLHPYKISGAILDPAGNSGAGKWYFMDGEACSNNSLGTTSSPRFTDAETQQVTGASPAGLELYVGSTTDHTYRACQSPGAVTRIKDFSAHQAEVFMLLTEVDGYTTSVTFEDATATGWRWTPSGGSEMLPAFPQFDSDNYWSCGSIHQLDEDGNAIMAVAWKGKQRHYADIEQDELNVYYEQGGPVVRVYSIGSPFGPRPEVVQIGEAEPGGEFTVSLVSMVPGAPAGEVVFDVHAAVNELFPHHRQAKRLLLRVGSQPVKR